MRNFIFVLVWLGCGLVTSLAHAQDKSSLFQTSFENERDTRKWALLYGAEFEAGEARTGESAVKFREGEASMRSTFSLTEQGTLEFWIKTSSAATQYKINVLVASSLNNDSAWTVVGQISGNQDAQDYRAKRISVDDPGRKYLRLDVEVSGGDLWLDDLRVEKILLDTALQKNQQKIITQVLDKLREDKDYEVQAEALRALGVNYAAQIDIQRQYLEYANGIYASVTLVLATSERSKMANPLGYQTFKTVVDNINTVATPMQKARMNSLLKPLGDIATAGLNLMTNGAYQAFSEPFKTIVATTFDKAYYSNADLNRSQRKFAEKNGMETYQKTEKFLGEIEKELTMVTALDKDLQDLQRDLDKYRQDLDKHLRETLIDGGLGRGQDNYNRIMSKDEATRAAALQEVTNYFVVQAESYQNHTSSNTQFLQFMMKATSKIEESQVFKERFNQIAASVISYYDKFDRSIASDQNPFSEESDRKIWEERAVKVRAYLKDSKAAFTKAYM